MIFLLRYCATQPVTDFRDAIVVVAKATNSEQIIGKYNSLQWDLSNSWKFIHNSFIFSFTNRTNPQGVKARYSIV